LNLSIGQGDTLTTPLQLLRMMASVAREGREVQPHLIKEIDSENIISFSTVKNLKIKKKIFEIIKSGLRSVVTDDAGTARRLNMEGFTISGKTGTAQTVPGKAHHAWFVGYNMGKRKNIAFCVFLEHGGSSYNAVRLARELLKRLRSEDVL